jgi:hypothetical protein
MSVLRTPADRKSALHLSFLTLIQGRLSNLLFLLSPELVQLGS